MRNLTVKFDSEIKLNKINFSFPVHHKNYDFFITENITEDNWIEVLVQTWDDDDLVCDVTFEVDPLKVLESVGYEITNKDSEFNDGGTTTYLGTTLINDEEMPEDVIIDLAKENIKEYLLEIGVITDFQRMKKQLRKQSK